jgi:hypothetical protein
MVSIRSTLTDMKNRPVFTLHPQGEQAGFSDLTPWGRGKKAEIPGWILICQSRISISLQNIKNIHMLSLLKYVEIFEICNLIRLLVSGKNNF